MDKQSQDQLQPADDCTEKLLLYLTECKSLSDINVLSLRSKDYTRCFNVVSKCN